MDWVRKIPIGQYVSGNSGWLRRIDPRMKMTWVLMFLLSPILAGSIWRIGLELSLILITFLSLLPFRLWWRSFFLVLIFSILVGLLAMLLPIGEDSFLLSARSPDELPNIVNDGLSWEILKIGPFLTGDITLGPLIVNRRSAELAINTSTLLFTVVHSVNLMLLTTPPEDLAWSLHWFLSPLGKVGIPVERMSFQLLLALRFLPLVQEELQNLLRALSTRAVNIRKLGFKATLGLLLSVCERLLSNILLRAEQGADALIARGGQWLPPKHFKAQSIVTRKSLLLNIASGCALLIVFGLRKKYGAL